MLSLIAMHTHIPKSEHPLSRLNYPLISCRVFMHNSRDGVKRYRPFTGSGFIQVKTWGKLEGGFDDSWCCWCKRFEGDRELDEEIIEFMEKSEKPKMFPTQEELLRAGRMDLVEAIKKRGGWYSLGWGEANVGGSVEEAMEDDGIGEFRRRVEIENRIESAALGEEYYNSFPGLEEGYGFSSATDSSPGTLNSLQLPSSASLDRSLEVDVGEATGIKSILIGLEKQRNTDFGINLRKYDHETHAKSKDERDDRDFSAAINGARTDPGGSSVLSLAFQHKGIFNTFSGKISPDHQVGFQHAEAAEISFSKNQVENNQGTYHDRVTVTTEEYAEACSRHEDINHNQIRIRLQHLELELTTALRSLRSKREQPFPEEVIGSSSALQKLSDAWEFQENEFMSAQDALRSIRSKLAVLEGKMALALIDAQKIVKEKQKRIDTARKALQLLRTTFIMWPSSASEVLLAGSFDGWTTQRKMKRSRTGIFSVSLKLYPGKYEIKFIVDGIWKVDPLHPIINYNGYENNLLIVA